MLTFSFLFILFISFCIYSMLVFLFYSHLSSLFYFIFIFLLSVEQLHVCNPSTIVEQINKQFFFPNNRDRFNGFRNDLILVSDAAFKLLRAQACTFDWTWSRCTAPFDVFRPNTSHDFRVHPSNNFSRALLYQGFAVLPVTSVANAIGTTDKVEGISVCFDNSKRTLFPAAVRIMDIPRLHADPRYRNIFF